VFGIEVLEEIHSARIHTNPTQPPPKTGFIESQDRAMIDEFNRGFGFCALV
jgi:hypothetical protein